MGAKLTLVALDAADLNLLNWVAQAGFMPNFSNLMSTGQLENILTPDSTTDDSFWASFQYECDTGVHGRYFWDRLSEDRRDRVVCDQDEDGFESFWEPQANAGKKIAIFDLPKMKLTSPKGGIHLANWRIHGRYGDGPTSYPKSLATDITAAFGNPPNFHASDFKPHYTDAECDELVAELIRSIQLKCSAASRYLQSQDWDFFATSFEAIHTVSHDLWDRLPAFSDEATPHHPIVRICRAIDEALSILIAASGRDASVWLLSSSSMGLNSPVGLASAVFEAHLNRCLIGSFSKALNAIGIGRKMIQCIPFNEDAIAIRMPLGSSKQTAELLARVIEYMSGFKTPDGKPLFSDAVKIADIHAGPRIHRLPHVLFHPALDVKNYKECVSPNGTHIEFPEMLARSGNHRSHGFLLMSHSVKTASIAFDGKIASLGKLVTSHLN